jgi:hypothetical protein
MQRKLDVFANLAILVVAGLLSYVLITRYISSNKTPHWLAVGEKLSLEGAPTSKGERTLVLALQRGCHFCAESAPFYRQLVTDATEDSGVHLVAALPQASAEGAAYIHELGIAITDVRQASLQQLRMRGTPTLILLGSDGVVQKLWVGKLPAEKEQEVFRSILPTVGNNN